MAPSNIGHREGTNIKSGVTSLNHLRHIFAFDGKNGKDRIHILLGRAREESVNQSLKYGIGIELFNPFLSTR